MHFIKALVLLVVVINSVSLAFANDVLLTQIKSELKGELYSSEYIVPNIGSGTSTAIKLAVAEFIASDDLISESQMLATILRYNLQYSPKISFFMPDPMNTRLDAGLQADQPDVLLVGQKNFSYLQESLGVEWVLTGALELTGSEYQLEVKVVNAETGTRLNKHKWTFLLADSAAALQDVVHWVYELFPGYAQSPTLSETSGSITAALNAAEEIKTLSGPLRRDRSKELQRQFPHSLSLAVFAIYSRVYAVSAEQAYENLEFYDQVLNSNPDNVGLQLSILRYMEDELLPKAETEKKLKALKKLASENPQDSTILLNVADALIAKGDTTHAISLMLKAVEQWPNNYRSWWSLSWALNSYAWQVRGNKKWRDVPAKSRGRYITLGDLADRSIDEALKLNPRNGQLWSQKINTYGSLKGYTDKLLVAFDRAIKTAPKNKQIYDNAMNFSTKQWGGTKSARQHIFDMAIENNPGEAWPVAMKNYFAPELDTKQEAEDLLDLSDTEKVIGYFEYLRDWRVIFLLIVAVLWLAFALGRRSKS